MCQSMHQLTLLRWRLPEQLNNNGKALVKEKSLVNFPMDFMVEDLLVTLFFLFLTVCDKNNLESYCILGGGSL